MIRFVLFFLCQQWYQAILYFFIITCKRNLLCVCHCQVDLAPVIADWWVGRLSTYQALDIMLTSSDLLALTMTRMEVNSEFKLIWKQLHMSYSVIQNWTHVIFYNIPKKIGPNVNIFAIKKSLLTFLLLTFCVEDDLHCCCRKMHCVLRSMKENACKPIKNSAVIMSVCIHSR